MSSNPLYYKKFEKLTKCLVKSLVDFDETSENFEACTEYGLSNLLNHKFLSVDSHNVTRSYNNLAEKLMIHSNTKKAEVLKKYVKLFSETDICPSILSKSDTHYALLSLLLNLSKNVLHTEYTEKTKPKHQNEIDSFDWGAYLLEGVYVPEKGDRILDDLSDAGSDFEDIEADSKLSNPKPNLKKNIHSDFTISHSLHDSLLKESDRVIHNLKKDHVIPYWSIQECKTKYQEFTHPMRMFLTVGISDVPLSGLCIEEVHIGREVIWLLMGQTNLTIFPLVGENHTVCDSIMLSHVTPESVKCALSSLCIYGDIVHTIQNFIFKCPEKLQTYRAFADSLLKYVQGFKHYLLKVQDNVIKQQETLLITDLMHLLCPYLYELKAINEVFEVSIKLDKTEPELSNPEKVSRLLGALYHMMLNHWYSSKEMGDENNQSNFYTKAVLLWLDTVEPYLIIIDQWISRGMLTDPFYEFIIQRKISCYDSMDSQFWTNAVIIKGDNLEEKHPWLTPLLNEIIVSGKSMEVLETTGSMFKRLNLDDLQNNNNALYKQFVNNIRNNYTNDSISVSSDSKCNESVAELTQRSSNFDALFHLNFEKLLKHKSENKKSPEWLLQLKYPIPVVITRSLHPLIHEKCKFANKLLLNVILEEQLLQQHLSIFQKYHLMGWGDVMYDFTRSVFDKISDGEYWRDLTSLKGSLQDAILDSNPYADPNEVMVRLKQKNLNKTGGNEIINATDIIELGYKVEWPINLIITPESMEIYNTVFRYLLKVKRALYCMESLRFQDCLVANQSNLDSSFADEYEEPDENELSNTQKAHRLALLRAKVLRLVSHWHNFIMTNVIMSEEQSFKAMLSKAENIDQIRQAHMHFLNRIITLSLLENDNKASKIVQGTMQKILHLSVIIHSQWKRGVNDMSTSTLKKYEAQHNECSEFLSVILKNIVNRGAVPLLESLAYFYVEP